MELFCARQRRKFSRGIKRASGSSSSWVCCDPRPITVLKKLRKAKRDTAYGEKPEAVKTHLRNMVIVPLGDAVSGCVGIPSACGESRVTSESVAATRSILRPEMIGALAVYLGMILGSIQVALWACTTGSSTSPWRSSRFLPQLAR